MSIESAQDIEDLFDVNDFSESVTLAGVPVVGTWDDAPADDVDDMEATYPTFTCPVSRLGSAAQGSTLVRGAVTYTVHEINRDGTGKIAICSCKRS